MSHFSAEEIIQQRLNNQYLSLEKFEKNEDIVAWFGAIQAQDYNAAKWALALRSINSTENSIETSLNEGKVLRTHVLRPTWHFVSPENIRWMLQLTAPRIKKAMNYYHKSYALDNKILERSNNCIREALKNGKFLTRKEIANVLAQEGIHDGNLIRLSHLMMFAELDGIICNGIRRGNQFTYALLDEQVPFVETFNRQEALGKLAKLYFQSHGPATLKDFVWWSGLTVADAKVAIATVQPQLEQAEVEEKTFWFYLNNRKVNKQNLLLLPNYDEYIVGYADRSFIFDASYIKNLDSRSNPLFQNTLVYDGKIIGTWKKENKKNTVSVLPNFFESTYNTPLFQAAKVQLISYYS